MKYIVKKITVSLDKENEAFSDDIVAVLDKNIVLKNNTDEDISIYSVSFYIEPEKKYEKVYTSDFSMGSETDVRNAPCSSSSVIGLSDENGNTAVIGALSPFDAFYDFYYDKEYLKITIRLQNKIFSPEEEICMSEIVFSEGKNIYRLFDEYGKLFAKKNNIKFNREKYNGWCSWYYYYGQENKKDILENLRQYKNSPLGDKIDVIQIDDGWNCVDGKCMWGDWVAGEKFDCDMKSIADKIHSEGFKAGIWLAPFSVSENSNLYKEHKDWLVRKNGSPLRVPGGYFTLDLTNEEVLDYIKCVFERVFDEWGYDYIKIDFLQHSLNDGERKNMRITPVEAYRNALKIIRETGRNKFILHCGAAVFQSAGLCDSMRIGLDVGSRWNVSELKNCCIRVPAKSVLLRQWMHNRLWQNDPDCIVVRSFASEYEKNIFSDRDNSGLSETEAQFWIKLLWMSGNRLVISEVYEKLSKNEKKFLGNAFVKNEKETELYFFDDKNDIAVMKSTDEKLVGIFNMGDSEYLVPDIKEKGYRDLFTNENIEKIPPHGAVVFNI